MRETMLILHLVGLAMGLGTSIGFMFLGMASSKMDKEEAISFHLKALALGKMGHIGLGLLIASGGYLMTPHWQFLASSPLLITKFCLVILLIVLMGVIASLGKKARSVDPEKYLRRMEPIGKLALLTALIIVVLAVLHFR